MFGNRQHIVLVGCTIHGSKETEEHTSKGNVKGKCFATVVSKHYKNCLLGQSLIYYAMLFSHHWTTLMITFLDCMTSLFS